MHKIPLHPITTIKTSERLATSQVFTNPFCYTPHPLCLKAKDEMMKIMNERKEWKEELDKGKMLGVLVVESEDKRLWWIGAYSGQLCDRADWEDFVPNIFDYLQPDGFFKTEERQISLLNKEIELMSKDILFVSTKEQLKQLTIDNQKKIEAMKKDMAIAKQERDKKRACGASQDILDKLTKESQFQKAELKRLRQKAESEENELATTIETHTEAINKKKKEREQRSVRLQQWLFEHFEMVNARGEKKNLVEIFEGSQHITPPSGAGECCAPKLLQYAYQNNLKPKCMMEWWWGESPKKEIRVEGQHYAACQSKCGPILEWMLKGLETEQNQQQQRALARRELRIIYEDEWMLAVDKPSGMLSVNGNMKAQSVESIVKEMYPDCNCPMIVHRLDMDTSGIMLIAKNKDTHEKLQKQFEDHSIQKKYVAVLDGEIADPEKTFVKTIFGKEMKVGIIDLPICADITDRPRQMVDRQNGKRAVTYYCIEKKSGGKTYVNFYPQTGRTHQLRVHSAHKEGLGTPIAGDELYGNKEERLQLYATEIEFWHPEKEQKMRLSINPSESTPR